MCNLIDAYINNTDYIFYDGKTRFCININQYNQDIDNLLEKYKVENIVMITAYNPMSKLTNESKNIVMNESLKMDIENMSLKYFDGENIAKDNSFPSEKSIFVLNLKSDQAILLMKKYHQKGIVITDKSGVPKLILNDITNS